MSEAARQETARQQASRQVVAAATSRGLSVATAESLTAGLVAAALADVPGASAMLQGGVVAYQNSVKERVLGVDPGLLARAGSVDGDVARQMADGVRRLAGADIGVATTGVAGPAAHDGKDVGTVYVGVATAGGGWFREYHFHGGRMEIRAQACSAALEQLGMALQDAVTSAEAGNL